MKNPRPVRSEPPKKKDADNALSYSDYQSLVDEYRNGAYYDRSFDQHLAGKRVVLVGPSPSLEGTGNGELIDGYDLVARVNKGYPVTGSISADIGERTDLHYHCLHESAKCGGPIHYEQMTEDGVYLCSPYPPNVVPFNRDVDRFRRERTKRKLDLRAHFFDYGLYLGCAAKIGTRPNSGVLAILDLLAHNVSELQVTGFTFFQDGWRKTYKDGGIMEPGWEKAQFSGTHFQKPQMQVVKQLLSDERLVLDNPMRRVLGLPDND